MSDIRKWRWRKCIRCPLCIRTLGHRSSIKFSWRVPGGDGRLSDMLFTVERLGRGLSGTPTQPSSFWESGSGDIASSVEYQIRRGATHCAKVVHPLRKNLNYTPYYMYNTILCSQWMNEPWNNAGPLTTTVVICTRRYYTLYCVFNAEFFN